MYLVLRVYIFLLVKERTLQWQQWQRFSNFDNLLDTSFEVWHHVDVSLVICAVHCGESNSCLSFFYHQAYKTCKGVSVEYGNPNELADYANGSKYYKGKIPIYYTI